MACDYQRITLETFLGAIALFPYGYAPLHWAECDGALLPIAQHTPLYSLLGAQFGGDGKVTFALPDLRSKAPGSGMKYYIALQGLWPTGPAQ